MREFFKPILIMGFLALFTSCTSDDNEVDKKAPETTELIVPSSMSITYPTEQNSSAYYQFEYIENSHYLSKMTIKYSDNSIERGTLIYENNLLTKILSSIDGESNSMDFNYNTDHKVTSIIDSGEDGTSLYLEYNENGLISFINLEEENSPIYFSFIYNNSKSIVKSEMLYFGEPIGYSSSFEYDDKSPPFKNTNIKFDLGQYDLLSITMFNQNNYHNISKITTSLSEDEKMIYTFEYTYNDDGYPSKVIKTEVGTGVESIITYEYKTITITE